jgi:hypothetical protein
MNKIVRHHDPADRLPDDLRAALDSGTREVKVTIEGADAPAAKRSLLEIVEAGRRHSRGTFRSADEIVDYIRAVRDGGDLSPWLGSASTSTPTS